MIEDALSFQLNESEYLPAHNNPSAKFGLPSEVQFCVNCCVSNQRPNSAIEYKNKVNSKKTTINFDSDGVCDACNFALQKKKLIGTKEKKNF